MMTSIRWWLFKRLSAIGWLVCPEPHRSNLQGVMPTWQDIRARRDEFRAALKEAHDDRS